MQSNLYAIVLKCLRFYAKLFDYIFHVSVGFQKVHKPRFTIFFITLFPNYFCLVPRCLETPQLSCITPLCHPVILYNDLPFLVFPLSHNITVSIFCLSFILAMSPNNCNFHYHISIFNFFLQKSSCVGYDGYDVKLHPAVLPQQLSLIGMSLSRV